MLDVSFPTIARWSWNNTNIPKMWTLSLKLILENIELKNKLEIIKQAQKILKNL